MRLSVIHQTESYAEDIKLSALQCFVWKKCQSSKNQISYKQYMYVSTLQRCAGVSFVSADLLQLASTHLGVISSLYYSLIKKQVCSKIYWKQIIYLITHNSFASSWMIAYIGPAYMEISVKIENAHKRRSIDFLVIFFLSYRFLLLVELCLNFLLTALATQCFPYVHTHKFDNVNWRQTAYITTSLCPYWHVNVKSYTHFSVKKDVHWCTGYSYWHLWMSTCK